MDQQNANETLKKQAGNIAEKTYHPSDYESSSITSQGLAMTHEQVSDNYMEGTNDGKIDEIGGRRNVPIPRKG